MKVGWRSGGQEYARHLDEKTGQKEGRYMRNGAAGHATAPKIFSTPDAASTDSLNSGAGQVGVCCALNLVAGNILNNHTRVQVLPVPAFLAVHGNDTFKAAITEL